MKATTTVALLLAVLFAPASCTGTTGSDLIAFPAYAAGPQDALVGEPYSFRSGYGYDVTLTRAALHIGAVYLNQNLPLSGAGETPCVLPGIYVAEVTRGLDVDLLSPALQPFPASGEGTLAHARSGEVWLMGGGDVNADDDETPILDIAGTASRGGVDYPFEGTLRIGKNRAVPPRDPSQPGANPICEQRIVGPIATDLTPEQGGALVVRADPRGFFANVDFARLEQASAHPLLYRFADGPDNQPSINLYQTGLRSSQGVYSFAWESR